jgi:hypothetical protein
MAALSPAALAEYFRRKRRPIAELERDDVIHNESIWAQVCGLLGGEADPSPILSRDEAARLDDPFRDHRRFGPIGQFVSCIGCGLTFETRGLRLCPDCYPVLGDKDERKVPSSASRPVRKQVCRQCGGDLPAYRPDGKKARSTSLYCSKACGWRAWRDQQTAREHSGVEGPEPEFAATRGGVDATPAPLTAAISDEEVLS